MMRSIQRSRHDQEKLLLKDRDTRHQAREKIDSSVVLAVIAMNYLMEITLQAAPPHEEEHLAG